MPLRFKRDALGGGGRESRAELPSKEEGGQLPEGIVMDAPKPQGRDGTPGKSYHSRRARVPQPPSRLAVRVVTPAVPAKERQASSVLKLPGKLRDRVTFK